MYMFFEALQSIGLNQHEQDVYVFLLKTGKASPSDIENSLKMHRPTVYGTISSLLEKGLLKVFKKGKRKQYVAENPDALQALFKQTELKFFEDIEDLHLLYEKSGRKRPVVTYAQGRKAVMESYMDIPRTMEKEETYYRYISSSEQNRTEFIPRKYREFRDKKGLNRLIICNKKIKKDKPSLGSEVKVVPTKYDLFEDQISQVIYKDKVSIVDFDAESVITIISPKFAEFQKKIFKMLYDKL